MSMPAPPRDELVTVRIPPSCECPGRVQPVRITRIALELLGDAPDETPLLTVRCPRCHLTILVTLGLIRLRRRK